MKWIDYREKLGIGFSDTEKFQLLKSKTLTAFSVIEDEFAYEAGDYFKFCMEVGIPFQSYNIKSRLWDGFSKCNTLREFLSYYIAFINSYSDREWGKYNSRKSLVDLFIGFMVQAGIPCELFTDADGIYIFPKGAKELDDALVSAPLEWLQAYPSAYKAFCTALRQYSDGIYIRDTADNFRKALEAFLQEFFGNGRNLDYNIKEVGNYIKQNGGENEITSILVGLMNVYNTLNNKIAKHNDKVDKRFLEFLMYQTGLFIRMLIVLKQSEAPQEDV